MAHSLILGMTESGKTTLAKALTHQFHKQGIGVLLLDPMNDPGYAAHYRTADPSAFLDVLWANQSCMCFVDESADMVGRFDTTMQQTATKGRHFGHSCFYISQRGAQLSATVRAQCRHLYLFTSAKDDCKTLANEFNKPELLNANSLPQGHFYDVSRFGPATLRKLW